VPAPDDVSATPYLPLKICKFAARNFKQLKIRAVRTLIDGAADGREKPFFPAIQITFDLLLRSVDGHSLFEEFRNTFDQGNQPAKVRRELVHVPF
jgi:hypothetical protein